MTTQEYTDMPGVNDLTGKAKMAFALALKYEAEGDTARAEKYLDLAIKVETEVKEK